jgi:hypothetical protein
LGNRVAFVGVGIDARDGIAIGDFISGTSSIGLKMSRSTGYQDNVISPSDGLHAVGGGINMGHNVCGEELCRATPTDQ